MIPSRFYIPETVPPVSNTKIPPPQSPQGTLQRKPSSSKKKSPTNSPSILLTLDENELVYSILGQGRQTLATAIVQFLIPSENPRRWKLQEVGVLCFVRDSRMRSYFLEILSLRMLRVIFSQEIYDEFSYRKPRPSFITFEGDNFTIGLNFASREEILSFQAVLDDKMAAKRERKAARQSRIFEQQNSSQRFQPHPTNQQSPANGGLMSNPSTPGYQRRTRSFENKLDFGGQPIHTSIETTKPPSKKGARGGRRKSTNKPKKKVLTKNDIGLPTDFRVVLHAGLDNERGFVVDNYMDEKFSKLFHMAGVTDKHLEDEKTRDFIIDFIQKYEVEPPGANKTLSRATGHKAMGNASTAVGKPQTGSVLTPPPPPSIVTRNPSGTANIRPPPPVPARQTPPDPSTYGQRGQTIAANTKPNSTRPNRGSISSPSLRSDITIQPIRNGGNIPNPPPPPPLLVPGGGSHLRPPPTPPPLMNNKPTTLMPPPPPPMPSMAMIDSNSNSSTQVDSGRVKPVEDERSALMKQIQEGKKLKKVEPDEIKKPGGGLLLDQIKQGVDLKKVSDTVRPGPIPDSMNGLAGALARALAERQAAINPDTSSSDSDEDGDDVFDEDEWE